VTPRASVGVDLVPVARIARLVERHGDLEGRLFTAAEVAHSRGRRRRAEHLAARFAAKEAVLKAFGTGKRGDFEWTDVEVVTDDEGRPSVHLHGTLEALATERGLRSIELSLSHTDDLAIAHALALWESAGTD
jgi:holo-[acyl-carrier protein] synthase